MNLDDFIGRLTKLLDYNPQTGAMIWKAKPSKRIKAGDRAGCVRAPYRPEDAFLEIKFEEKPYPAQKLAWLIMYKQWPAGQVGFANGDCLDLRISNLTTESAKVSEDERACLKVVGCGPWFRYYSTREWLLA